MELELEFSVESYESEETQWLFESRELGKNADMMKHSTFERRTNHCRLLCLQQRLQGVPRRNAYTDGSNVWPYSSLNITKQPTHTG